MIAFSVKSGTPAKAIHDSAWWPSPQYREITTSQDHLFFLEDLAIDPTGIGGDHASVPQHTRTIGGALAEAGLYGFRCKDDPAWMLLVPASQVEVG